MRYPDAYDKFLVKSEFPGTIGLLRWIPANLSGSMTIRDSKFEMRNWRPRMWSKGYFENSGATEFTDFTDFYIFLNLC